MTTWNVDDLYFTSSNVVYFSLIDFLEVFLMLDFLMKITAHSTINFEFFKKIRLFFWISMQCYHYIIR